ncbi:phosphatase PAP2 family protein [Luteimonas sp. 22616]|uniref:phosphatase PAP2 family protein n=1 Tax=Luteimonas sp. 22616 TaxID=3453951 RepID=UPI003F83A609
MNNPLSPDSRASRAQVPGAELSAIPVSFPHGLPGRLARAGVPSWALWQLLVPLAAFVAANVVLLQFGGDRWIAGHLYLWEGGHWALKDNPVTSTLIHQGGKRLSALAWLGVVACALIAWRRPAWRTWCKPLLYLALAVLLSTSIVAWMKSWTHVDCPWDLVGFGGTRSYHDLLAALPAHAPPGRCFPAGHASAGYAWLALFFFLGDTRPSLRWKGFAVGLGAGVVFGIAQQLRGAHFASHDLWTLMLCWLVAVLLHRAMFARRTRVQAANAAALAGRTP